MKAGDLGERVVIEQVTEVRDLNYGTVTRSWATFATVWAAVEPQSGQEVNVNGELGARLQVRVRIRYLAGVTPKMRLRWGTRTLQIESVVEPLAAGRELVLDCTEYQGVS